MKIFEKKNFLSLFFLLHLSLPNSPRLPNLFSLFKRREDGSHGLRDLAREDLP